jgi:hypothetical protein
MRVSSGSQCAGGVPVSCSTGYLQSANVGRGEITQNAQALGKMARMTSVSSFASIRAAAAALFACTLAACGTVGAGVGIGIPVAPGVSVGVGAGSGGITAGVGAGRGPVGAGVGVDQRGRVTGSVGVGASAPLGKARVGVGAGTGTVLYDPEQGRHGP